MRYCLVFFALLLPLHAAEIYVSPTGTFGGAGTTNDPINFEKAITNSTPAVAGDTIWLLAGTYFTGSDSNIWHCSLKATTNNPIKLRAYPGQRAIVQPAIEHTGSNVWLWGFEISNPSTVRTNYSYFRNQGLEILGPDNKCINLYIHDCGQPGIGCGSSAERLEIHGCLISGNGLYDIAWGGGGVRGSAIYAQNSNEVRLVEGNISFRNFTTGMKAYTQAGYADSFHVRRNIFFHNGADGIEIISDTNPQTNIVVESNYTYYNGDRNHIGTSGGNAHDAIVINNYFVNEYVPALSVRYWEYLTMTNNNVVTVEPLDGATPTDIAECWTNATQTAVNVSSNYYWGGGTYPVWGPIPFVVQNAAAKWIEWTNWTGGWDVNSVFTPTNLPGTDLSVVLTNKYETGRCHIVVYNWTAAPTTTVSLSGSGLVNGQQFRIYDAQYYEGAAVVTNIYSASHPTVVLPLTMTNTTHIVGDQSHFDFDPNEHTASRFNAFVLLPGEVTTMTYGRWRTGKIKGVP